MTMATDSPLRSPERTPDQPSLEVLGLGCDDFFSLIFFLPETQYMELELESERQQGAHELELELESERQVVGPLGFIFCRYFSYFLRSGSVMFQVILRMFVPAHK